MNDTLIQGRLMPVNTSPAHVLAVASNFGLAIVMQEDRMVCRRSIPGGVLEYRARLSASPESPQGPSTSYEKCSHRAKLDEPSCA